MASFMIVRNSSCGAYFTSAAPPDRWSDHPTDAAVFRSRAIAETIAEHLGDDVMVHPVSG